MWHRTVNRQNFPQYEDHIMDLYLNSPLGQQLEQWILKRYLMGAIHYEQMMLYGDDQGGSAVITWAALNEQQAEQYEKTQQIVHWCCGDQIYLQDAIVERLNMLKPMKHLKNYMSTRYGAFQAQWFRQNYTKKTSRKGGFKWVV